MMPLADGVAGCTVFAVICGMRREKAKPHDACR